MGGGECFWRLLRLEGNSEDDVRTKLILFPACVLLLPMCVSNAISGMLQSRLMYVLGNVISGTGITGFMVGVVLNLTRVPNLVDFLLVMGTIGVCVTDVSDATHQNPFRSWSSVVLILDMALLCGRKRIPVFAVPFTLAYLFADCAESATRYGLREVGYWGTGLTSSAICDCVSPPCRIPYFTAVNNFIGMSAILLLDFYFTRKFALGMRQQLQTVRSSIHIASVVTSALAGYNVDDAEAAIKKGENLPPELVESYTKLLSNLRLYRCYLPDSLFADNSVTSPQECVSTPLFQPPVPVDGQVHHMGMVFTDIQSSTLLWERYPNDMLQALRTHNATLRKVAREHRGYEVKIAGDVLMLAFDTACDALRFGVEAQLRLVMCEWPNTLCQDELCKRVEGPDGVPLWNGLRVKVGIHWGKVQKDNNPVTHCPDFYGNTVNTASRVESALQLGGLTGVTQAVMDEVGSDCLSCVFTAPFGVKKLKGVAESIMIHIVLPQALAARWNVLSPEFDAISSVDGVENNIHPVQYGFLQSQQSPQNDDDSWQPWRNFLTLGLVGSSATCASVRGTFPPEDDTITDTVLTRLVVSAETAALRTNGQVVCVVSSLCVTAWNACTRCSEHLAQAALFVELLAQQRHSNSPPARTGIASGRVLGGTIPGTRRRHVTVAGSCVELSILLADRAALRGFSFMAVGGVGINLSRLGLAARVDLWREVGGDEDMVVWGAAKEAAFPEDHRRSNSRAHYAFQASFGSLRVRHAEEKGWEDGGSSLGSSLPDMTDHPGTSPSMIGRRKKLGSEVPVLPTSERDLTSNASPYTLATPAPARGWDGEESLNTTDRSSI
eukprot:Hpha_TRINITY_DN15960_c3_g1::TRINITY_DN15960_c3_g1_i3::g.71003::m.71003